MMPRPLVLVAASVMLGCPSPPSQVSADAAAPLATSSVSDAAPPPREPTCRDDAGIWHLPNPAWTPGTVCTTTDPNFKEMRYGGRVAYCVRFVTAAEKDAVAALYDVPKADYAKYEFDHYIPLAAGGNDAKENLWPQPIAEAKDKDKTEVTVYNALAAGTMDQDEAIATIRSWRPASCP